MIWRARHRLLAAAMLASLIGIPARAQQLDASNRRALEQSIGRFTDRWRDSWQRGFIRRKDVIVNLPLVRSDLAYGNVTYEGRRYRAILCSAGWLGETELAAAQAAPQGGDVRVDLSVPRPSATERLVDAARARGGRTSPPDPSAPLPSTTDVEIAALPEVLNLWSARRVRGQLDKGQVCPQWTPPELGVPPDEGERLDLALPIEERAEMQRARNALLRELGAAASVAPDDVWLLGQQVRFALDNDSLRLAESVVVRCDPASAPCLRLRGLVLAAAGDLVASETSFRLATRLDAASGGPCADTTAFALLPEGPRRAAHRAPCARQRRLEGRLWWLADPHWSVAGNPRYVEHAVRQEQLVLRSTLERDERFHWTADAGADALRETIGRYGWPTHVYWAGWLLDEQINKGRSRVMMTPRSPYAALEYAPDRVALVPDWTAIDSPFVARPDAWSPHRPDAVSSDAWWPTEHMAFSDAPRPLARGQLAVLRRDATLRVGIAVRSPSITDGASTPDAFARVRWLASSAPDHLADIADTVVRRGATIRANGYLTPEPAVLSLETFATGQASRRLRFGVRPPPPLDSLRDDDVALSAPVFLDADATPSAEEQLRLLDPDVILARMAGTLTFSRARAVVIYWESYGIPVGDSAEVEVALVRTDSLTALRRAAARLGLAGALRDSVRIGWREPTGGQPTVQVATRRVTVGRLVAVNLSNVEPGRYAVRVRMRRSDGAEAREATEIIVQP